MIRSLFVVLCAAALLVAPAAAQRVQTLPAASALGGTEKMVATQGSGCASNTTPCSAVGVTPAQVATYVAGAALTAYPVTLTCGSGTLTSASGVGRYRRVGKAVFLQLRIAITTLGTCAGSISASLPIAAAATGSGSANDGWMFAGREDQATGNMLQGKVQQNTSSIFVFTYNNAFPAANNTILLLSGLYDGA